MSIVIFARGGCRAIRQRRDDDHLCLVAGITKIQMGELRAREVSTLAALAQMPLPLAWKPDRGVAASYERIREQARIQVQGRVEGKPLYETLPIVKEFGLSALPAPSPGDVFFDLEGDPFIDEGGLEYLFGYAFEDEAGSPVPRGLGGVAGGGEAGVRGLRRFCDGALAAVSGFSYLSLRAVRAECDEAADGAVRDAGGGNRSDAARAGVRGSVSGRAACGSGECGELFDQGAGAVLWV